MINEVVVRENLIRRFKELVATKSPAQLLDEVRGIIQARPFWGFSDEDLDNVRIPKNFKPRTETEIMIPAYYLDVKQDCESYQWSANRRNLDGHMAVFKEIEDHLGRFCCCGDLRKGSGCLDISGPDYHSGAYCVGLDIFNESKKLKPGFYKAGVEVIDLVNFYPDILLLFPFLPIPAFQFGELKHILWLLYKPFCGSAPSVIMKELPNFGHLMPTIRRLDADEY